MEYIAYYRVSTSEQGMSGLGIEAQQDAARSFAKNDCILAEYTEVESGKNNNRAELMKALQHAKNANATLLIAKLDRLSRNLTFISTLMDAHVKFKCCDMPEADNFTIHIFAALAQKEREQISARTKAALSALKARGVKLGGTKRITPEAGRTGNEAMKAKKEMNENNQRAGTVINLLRTNGATLQEITDELNKKGFKTSRGGTFRAEQVKRLITKN